MLPTDSSMIRLKRNTPLNEGLLGLVRCLGSQIYKKFTTISINVINASTFNNFQVFVPMERRLLSMQEQAQLANVQ